MARYPENPILLVDDDPIALETYNRALRAAGINNIMPINDGRQVMPLLAGGQAVDLVLLDLIMPHISGDALLSTITQDYFGVPVIMISGVNEVNMAVKLVKSGAFDYLVKPVERDRLVMSVQNALKFHELRRENDALATSLLSSGLKNAATFENIVSGDRTMKAIFQYVEAIAITNRPILITGETGVGKELVAEATHKASGRSGKFVPVNVGGLDDNLFTDTLFGHKKGAFTGADYGRSGLIEQASDGTLFLDEIGDLEVPSQVKLLRLLQYGDYYPLGSDTARLSNARIIAATNMDIMKMKEGGKFRKDLYYRLSAHHIHIPPLRDRLEDIPFLVDHFLEKAAVSVGKKKPPVPKELFQLLFTYHFPGNVRELQGMIYDSMSMHVAGPLSVRSFKSSIAKERDGVTAESAKPAVNGGGASGSVALAIIEEEAQKRFPTLEEAEWFLIDDALARAGGNQTIAAEMLGLTRAALNKRLVRRGKPRP